MQGEAKKKHMKRRKTKVTNSNIAELGMSDDGEDGRSNIE
jgi:hypothetical protein